MADDDQMRPVVRLLEAAVRSRVLRWPLSGWLALAAALPGRAEEPPVLTRAAVTEAVVRLASDAQPGVPEVLALTASVDGVVAVTVKPPYRDFPNVVLFRLDPPRRAWARAAEALVLGLQDEGSGVVDLHTRGLGVDFTVSTEDRQKLDALRAALGDRMAVVEYRGFFHAHQAGRDRYWVDKRAHYDLARKLFPDGRYQKGYPRDTCQMYDVPALLSVVLERAKVGWRLAAETDNGQVWTVEFDSIGEDGALRGKRVDARRK